MNKLAGSIEKAIVDSGLKSGMTISFHHHLRNGDHVLNMVMDAIASLGIRDLTVNASSLFDVHKPLAEHIKNGVVKEILTDYMSAALGGFMIFSPLASLTAINRLLGAAMIASVSSLATASFAQPCFIRSKVSRALSSMRL